MKKRLILIVVLLLVIFFGCLVGTYCLKIDGTSEYDPADLSVFDEDPGCFYLKNAPSDIDFQIETPHQGNLIDCSLVDSNGNEVAVEFKRSSSDSIKVCAPANGYIPGERYTLTLGNGVSFSDENLNAAQTLIFRIERETVEEYAFTDRVVEQTSAINQVSSDTISLEGLTAEQGDIVFGKDSAGDYVVYKIEEIFDDKTAAITIPAIDEIFSELDVCGEYEFDVADIVVNPELEAEIIENVKLSSFYSSLIATAYAAEAPNDAEFDVSITPDFKANTIQVKIKITLWPGKNGLFGITALKEHSVSLSLNTVIGLSAQADIQGISDWDVSATLTTDFSWDLDISCRLFKYDRDNPLDMLFIDKNEYADFDDYYVHNQFREYRRIITEKLDQLAADATEGEIKLFDWNLPIPSVPVLCLSAEVKTFFNLNVAANLSIGQNVNTTYTAGVYFKNGEFNTYSNGSKSSSDIAISLQGKGGVKTGVKFVVKATLIHDKVAYIQIDPQAGLYADLFVTIPTFDFKDAKLDRFMYSYFEPGVYFGANIEAHLNIAVKNYVFNYELFEKKYPFDFMTFGNADIAVGLSASTETLVPINNIVSTPAISFESYDVKKARFKTEIIAADKLEFSLSDGTALEENNGQIELPADISEDTCDLTVAYAHSDGCTYTITLQVEAAADAYKAYEALLTKGVTDSGLEINYYTYWDLEKDGMPELIVADALAWENRYNSSAELYCYRDSELSYCGATNSNYDYFYYVNDMYLLGCNRMGMQYLSADELIKTEIYHWNEDMTCNDPAISYNNGPWEYITMEEFRYYSPILDGSLESSFITSIEKLTLYENEFCLRAKDIEQTTISGPPGGKLVDPFAEGSIAVTFSGISGTGTGKIDIHSDDDIFSKIFYSLSPWTDLSNGDIVTLTASISNAKLDELGYQALERTEQKYTVSGLPEYYNLSDGLPDIVLSELCSDAMLLNKDLEEYENGPVIEPSEIIGAYLLTTRKPGDHYLLTGLNSVEVYNAVAIVTQYTFELEGYNGLFYVRTNAWIYPNWNIDTDGNIDYEREKVNRLLMLDTIPDDVESVIESTYWNTFDAVEVLLPQNENAITTDQS